MRDAEQFRSDLSQPGRVCSYLRAAASRQKTVITRAPGRLDVMGGVADYSGALVAEATIAEAALVALQPRTDTVWRFWSLDADSKNPGLQAQWLLSVFSGAHGLRDYAAVQARLTENEQTRWAAYLMGCVFVLMAEGYAPALSHGANVLLRSAVPLGAGVSSSAAIEVAMMQALNASLGLKLDGVTVARLAQIAENKVVGAPCGIMDQMASALGTENSLLAIVCQPHDIQGTYSWPEGVRLFGIDSHVVHSIGGGKYARARVAAFMARRLLGVDYLVNTVLPVGSPEFDLRLPEQMTGDEFMISYGETGDPVTRVDPDTVYPVRAAAEHGILEHRRVRAFLDHLSSAEGNAGLLAAGALMFQSHASYSRIGLGSPETDLLAALGRAAGPEQGIYGAKITGGGSGGTVAFLTRGADMEDKIAALAGEYQRQTGLVPQIVEGGKSPGAMAFGFLSLETC